MTGRVENINTDILRQCREQMGFDLEYVAKKIGSIKAIEAIERGEKPPTFGQLDKLASTYGVPSWVFISDDLPEEYRLNRVVSEFRKYSGIDTNAINDPVVRRLIARVERLRNLIIEVRKDMDEPVVDFTPPSLNAGSTPENVAILVREWLGTKENLKFSQWRQKLEERGIFIFMTGRYVDWSHIDKDVFRGLTIFHPTLPIIIVNDSDAKKAQSFTLFHELGHLLQRESVIDGWNDHQPQTERWCDQLAGNVLMPEDSFRGAVNASDLSDLDFIKSIADRFEVSAYACLVRLMQLEMISQSDYSRFADDLKRRYERLREEQRKKSGGPARNRPKEVLYQHGYIYTNAVFQAYHNRDIGLHKLCKLLGLKRASHALELETML